MFSIILIDDEIFQLHHLEKLLNWEDYGFSLKQAFFNPMEALDYLKNNKVDLVLTDISMPDVTGLDIARYLYQSSPDTKVIFLSAYEDFEYARQAISYGIFSYLVKPISIDALTNALSEAYLQLSKVPHYNQFRGSSDNAVIRQCFIDLLSDDTADADSLTERLHKLGIFINPSSAAFACITVSIDNSESHFSSRWFHGRERLIGAIEQIVNIEHQCAYCGLTFFYEMGFDIFIISMPDVTFEEFSHFVQAYMNSLPATFEECLHMSIRPNLNFQTQELSDLVQCRQYFLNQKQAINNNNKHQIFGEVKHFIEKNYNKEITLDSLASDTGFNATYFSKLFKEYFGVNFVSYLCGIRIEAAKKLLIDTDIRITTIHSMVGFSQHSYFVKQFKAHTGLAPVDYRNKYRKL